MTERDFCFWLQGFIDLNKTDSPTVDQWRMIKENLNSVSNNKPIDPKAIESYW